MRKSSIVFLQEVWYVFGKQVDAPTGNAEEENSSGIPAGPI